MIIMQISECVLVSFQFSIVTWMTKDKVLVNIFGIIFLEDHFSKTILFSF